MTLIVGIRCRDGVVMACDGAATFDALGTPTIRQEVSKLEIIDNSVVIGVSGPIGLGQRIKAELQAVVAANKNLRKGRPHEAMQILRGVFFKHVKEELDAAAVSMHVVGSALAQASAITATLVGIVIRETPTIIRFDQQCAPEESSNDLPFVAIGSGQPIADPFLAFLRRIFWPKTPPSVEEGVLAAVWTVQHAIQTHPGGVSEPIQVVVIKASNGDGFVARQLSEVELQEHRQWIGEVETALKDFPKTLSVGASAESIPQPQ